MLRVSIPLVSVPTHSPVLMYESLVSRVSGPWMLAGSHVLCLAFACFIPSRCLLMGFTWSFQIPRRAREVFILKENSSCRRFPNYFFYYDTILLQLV